VKCIRMRFLRDRTFKKSTFVELATEEEVNRIRNMTLTFQSRPLLILLKTEYFEKKKKEYEDRKSSKKTKGTKRKAAVLEEKGEDQEKEAKGGQEGKEETDKKEEFKVIPDLLVILEGLPVCHHMDIRTCFSTFGSKIAFVDRKQNAPDTTTSTTVRLNPESIKAQDVIKLITEHKPEIKGQHFSARLPTAEEDKAYWENYQKEGRTSTNRNNHVKKNFGKNKHRGGKFPQKKRGGPKGRQKVPFKGKRAKLNGGDEKEGPNQAKDANANAVGSSVAAAAADASTNSTSSSSTSTNVPATANAAAAAAVPASG